MLATSTEGGIDMNILRRVGIGFAATVAVMLSIAVTATSAFAHGDDGQDIGGITTVVLNQSLVPSLVGLGVAPVAPGTLTAPGGVYQVAFPITGVDDGRIAHAGGLYFGKAVAGRVKITKFVVDTGTGFLTAKARVNGQRLGRIPVFKLGGVKEVSPGSTPSCAGVAAGLYLTQPAADALGVADGTFVGDACVVPASSGEQEDEQED
jgi:hypothetical protein